MMAGEEVRLVLAHTVVVVQLELKSEASDRMDTDWVAIGKKSASSSGGGMALVLETMVTACVDSDERAALVLAARGMVVTDSSVAANVSAVAMSDAAARTIDE
jgi:hypothetical protein